MPETTPESIEPTPPVPSPRLPASPDAADTAGVAAVTPASAGITAPSSVRFGKLSVDLNHPFGWGFTATVGAIVALALAGAVSSLSTVLVSIGVALFIALALDPLVRWLERHRMSRGLSIVLVFVAFALVIAGMLALVAPTAVSQIALFASAVPGWITDIQASDWFKNLVAATGQSDLYATVLNQARNWLSDPANLLAIGGGALAVGTGVVNAVSGTVIVLALTLYFLASLRTMRDAVVRLAAAHARPQLREITNQVAESVGGYVSGMAILAVSNAVFSFIVLSIVGVPFAALLAVLALLVTMIPMVGSVLFWVLATSVSLFTSLWAAIIFTVVYAAYMQVEAYIMTPRVMGKAVDVPGSLVLIGALVGATLLGLLGALIAVPVTASLLMIVKTVVIPRQDAKIEPE
ncbi:MAG: AI-2E family transporter [Propionicimonas sp.]|uniref:AI-2E family transporter n=1 Tax=Propionicimonas sp. TaxID=1955623 RepID=UPI003D0BCC1A